MSNKSLKHLVFLGFLFLALSSSFLLITPQLEYDKKYSIDPIKEAPGIPINDGDREQCYTTVHGHVYRVAPFTPNGLPIEGATVKLKTSTGILIDSDTTDANGYYKVHGGTGKTCLVEVYIDGVKVDSETVQGGTNTELDFYIEDTNDYQLVP